MDSNQKFVTPIFHNPSGTLVTRGLLYEESQGNHQFVCYTTKENDYFVKGIGLLKSVKKAYLSYDDPTEYMFARDMFYSWSHWLKFKKQPFMRDNLEAWKEEHTVMLHAKAVINVMEVAKDDSSQYYLQANKYLLDKGFFKESKSNAGRPSKEAVRQKAEQLFRESSDVKDDYKRIISEGASQWQN